MIASQSEKLFIFFNGKRSILLEMKSIVMEMNNEVNNERELGEEVIQTLRDSDDYWFKLVSPQCIPKFTVRLTATTQ